MCVAFKCGITATYSLNYAVWKYWITAIHVLFNPLNAELTAICHLLALLGARHILHVSRIRFKAVCSWGMQWRSWLRQCAKSRKVTGSIPDGVNGIFHLHNPSGRIMALGLIQPLTGLTTLSPSCADCLEIWEPQPPGILRACPGL
jgi:hypothetical protein